MTADDAHRAALPPRERLPARLLLCSPQLPPHPSGHAAVLARQFRDIDPADYRMVGFGQGARDPLPGLARLEAPTRWLPTAWGVHSRRPGYPLNSIRSVRRFLTEVVHRGRLLAREVRTEGCGAILVTSSNTPDPAAAMVAARLAGVPFLVYMLDDWRHLMGVQDPVVGRVAMVLQRLILREARCVIVLNPLLRDSLAASGAQLVMAGIPLPDGVEADAQLPPVPWPATPGEVRIVFTGQVYGAHHEPIARVLEALRSPRLRHVTLHVYSGTAEDDMRRAGLSGRMVVHPHLVSPDILEVQRAADILLLPLAFDSVYPEIIRTAAPTKMGEYLTSGRPMLVHAPPDSYPALLARRDGVGALVDVPAVEPLVDAIERLMVDAAHRDRLVRAARDVGRREYSRAATTQRFLETLRSVLTGPA